MWSMKKMWSGKRLVLSSAYWVLRTLRFPVLSSAYWVLRTLRFGEARSKKQVSRCLFGGSGMDKNCEHKISPFPRAKSQYLPITNHYCRLIFFFTIISLSACNSNSKKTETKQQYTCAMHPQIIEDEPGNCPICGMELTPIRSQHHHGKHSVDSALTATDSLAPSTKTMIVKDTVYSPEISLDGMVTYNTNQMKSISARVSGRIEKSFVKYNFEPVKKGQLLVQVYSPELVAIQQELLFLKSQNDQELLHKTKTKLSLLGVSNQQINHILKAGKADYSINIYSNYTGYLLNPNQNTGDELQTANTRLNITQGQYINSGDLLFKVFDNSNLWAEFYTNTSGSEWLKTGTALNLKINGKTIKSKIDFVQPFFKNNQNYKLIRVVLSNQNHQYKTGELAKATAKASPISGVWIPEQAVYHSGEKNLVYIKTKNDMKPVEVQISAKANKMVLVKKGLASDDEIATNASYLNDSESFISKK